MHTFNDAHHPAEGKASLIYVTKNGHVKLRYQQHDVSWHEVSAELVHMLSAKELLTHAAFASNNGTTPRRLTLHTYQLTILP
jgi:mediator of RNA polymerase II transcription subunit 16, fungi type